MHFDTQGGREQRENPALQLIQRFVAGARSEGSGLGRSRQSRSEFILPGASEWDGKIQFPEQARSGAGRIQLVKAATMHGHGLRSKARRQASCAVYARVRLCENGHQHYQTYFCKNRHCPNEACGRRAFLDLFNKYLALDSVAAQIVPHWQDRPRRKPRSGDFVIAKTDITIRNLGRMPNPVEVRKFNCDVRRLFRDAERAFGLTYPKRVKVDGHMVPERPPRLETMESFGQTSSAGEQNGSARVETQTCTHTQYIAALSSRKNGYPKDGPPFVAMVPKS